MPTLTEIFGDRGIPLYQNESLDLDHYYWEPYQDQGGSDDVKNGECFETDKSKKKREIKITSDADRRYSVFRFFMDGSRRTYKIGDVVFGGKNIYPVVVAQVRAGCTERDDKEKKLHAYGSLRKKNLLLLSDKMNDMDFESVCQKIQESQTAKSLNLEVKRYKFDRIRDSIPVNKAIAKASAVMHSLEIEILGEMVHSKKLDTDRMLLVDGPLQFIGQDNGKPEFADLFYNVVGVSKSFDPTIPVPSEKKKRDVTQIGSVLLDLEYGERTPVYLKENNRGRKFGYWYLRIRPKSRVANPLEGIVKIEKIAVLESMDEGLNSSAVDNISLSILNEGRPTCYGKDARWAGHLYPVYLTETFVKSSFEGDLVFINHFKRDF